MKKDKIFCIGFPKTGTTSLEKALEELGYNVCRGNYKNNHTNYLIGLFYNKDFDEIDKIISYYDVFADLPWGGTEFYKYLFKKYPKAKFIHSFRQPESWYKSLEKMITKLDPNLKTAMNSFHKGGRYGAVYYLEKEYEITQLYQNEEKIKSHYIKINNEIEHFFKNNSKTYLKIKITEGEGWSRICKFLNESIPNQNFPNENKSLTIKPSNGNISKAFNLKKIIKKIIN